MSQQPQQQPQGLEGIATAAEVLEAARNLRKQAQNPSFQTTGSCEVHGDSFSGTSQPNK